MPDIFLRQGEANPADIRLRDTTTADAAGSFTSTATWDQAAASWAATAAEAYPSSATWLQAAATWNAVANEAFAATGSFVQAAAAWSAIVAETFASTATWDQATASWDALAAATGGGVNDFTATWTQAAATWNAQMLGPASTGGMGGRYERVIVRRYQEVVRTPEPVLMAAAWTQPPAGWRADMDTTDDDYRLLFDELVLIGVG